MGFLDDVLDNVGEPFKGGKGFEYGTHEVVIGTVEAKQKDTKATKDCAMIEVGVFDEANPEKIASCTLWFHTDGAAKMSVAKILGLLVHKVGEEKKDKVRELGKQLFGSIDDNIKARDVAAKLMKEKLVNEKAYLVAEPRGKYITTSYGDLWHYPAEPQGEKPTATEKVAKATGGEVVDDADIPEDL